MAVGMRKLPAMLRRLVVGFLYFTPLSCKVGIEEI